MSCTLDSFCKLSLLTFSQTSLLTSFDLTILIHISLQGLKVLVVKIWNVCSVFKNLCHLSVTETNLRFFSSLRARNESDARAALFPRAASLSCLSCLINVIELY